MSQTRAIKRNIKRARGIPLREPWKRKSRRGQANQCTVNKRFEFLHFTIMNRRKMEVVKKARQQEESND